MIGFLSTELSYLSAFCRAEPIECGIRLRDDGIRDLFAHNLTYLTHALSSDELVHLCREEFRIRKKEGMPFLNLTMENAPPARALEWLRAQGCERTVYDYFVYTGGLEHSRKDLAAVPMTPAQVAAALAFDLEVNGRDFGQDFIHRRFYRRKEVYLSGTVRHYLGYHAGRLVGMCDLFMCDGVAKLEDFDIAAPFQRQGFGRAMLAQLVARAQAAGAHTIYLVTDDAETAKEMYKKSGFVKAAEKYEILLPV